MRSNETALLPVDIESWNSPVARQFGLRSIPQFKVYDRSKDVVAEGDDAVRWVFQELHRAGIGPP